MIPLLFFLFTSWTTEVVTTGPVGLLPGIIALNSVGNPCILIPQERNGATRPLYYLFLYSKNNGTWITDTFELNAEGLPTGRWDLTIDRYNRIWCVYSIYTEIDSTLHLIVARKDSSGWSKDTVISSGGPFFSQSIATDTAGIPHIAYDYAIDGWDHGFYAYLDDTIWQKTLIDSSIFAYYCSIDLDSQNNPHISYFHYDYDSSGTIYEILSQAYRIDSVWFLEQIDSSAWYAPWSPTSICVGSDGLPGIAYIYPATYQVKYAWYDGAVWHIDTVDVLGEFETQKSLDIDSLGEPYFIYTSGSNSYVAYKTVSGWYKELLLLTPTVTKGFGGSLRIDKDGIIHIARFATNDDYSYREVHYIYGTPVGVEEDNQTLKFESQIPVLNIYPNPSQNIFKIEFNSPDECRLTVKIYDVAGELVEKIFDGKAKIGINEFLIMPKDISAGVYFVRVETTGFSRTGKVILLR